MTERNTLNARQRVCRSGERRRHGVGSKEGWAKELTVGDGFKLIPIGAIRLGSLISATRTPHHQVY